MEEEFEKGTVSSIAVETSTESIVEQETKLDSFPSIEELRKSEQQVQTNTEIEGVTQIEKETKVKDKIFTRKADEKKVYLKKRLKIVTAIYTTVVALLLGFAITNIATLAILNKDIKNNTQTIQSEQTQILVEESKAPTGESLGEYQISLNEPRDYSEDKKELTWLDKITILFRNLFG